MIEIIVKGKINRGKSIIMHVLYHTLKMLGFDVLTENVDFKIPHTNVINYVSNIYKVSSKRRKVKLTLERIEEGK